MPGSTRQVQGAPITLGTQTALMLYDTPGIEDSIGLLDYLEQLSNSAQRLDGPERIRLFLDSPEASSLYEQEARVLRKLLSCHAGLYVVDVREPVLSKHRDELAILSSCARPLLPILNFVASDTARTQEWRDALARVGLHTALSFDSMSPPIDGEESQSMEKKDSIKRCPCCYPLSSLRSRHSKRKHPDSVRPDTPPRSI